jgi:septum formation inhibitor-activating ATPase MinD
MNPLFNRRVAQPGAQLWLALALAISLQPTASSARQGESTASGTASSMQLRQLAPADVSMLRTMQSEVQPSPNVAPRAQARPRNKQRAKNADRRKQAAAVAKQQAEQREAAEREQRRDEKVRELLARAQRDYAAGRLIEPSINNAADRYREALALDPTNLEALAGAKRIVGILAEETQHAAAAGDVTTTRVYIARIRALQPDDPSLLELDARFNALMTSPVVLSERQQERYDRSAQGIEKAFQALRSESLDMQTITMAMDEYDRAARLVARAPGLPMLKDRIIVTFPAATRAELANDNSRRALKVVQMARERGWFSPELEFLEMRAKEALESKR